MPNTPNTSFIPRRGPAKRSPQNASRQVYVLTTLSYIIFSATLMATAGLFFYDRHVKGQLQDEVVALNSAISIFSEADMEQVRDLDLRLIQVRNRVENSASIVSIFKTIEEAIVKSAQLTSLTLERNGDSGFSVNAEVKTDTFDATFFQRTLLTRSDTFSGITVNGLKIGGADIGGEGSRSLQKAVDFNLELTVPLASVPYVPDQGNVIDEVVEIEITPEVSTSSVEVVSPNASSSNQNPL